MYIKSFTGESISVDTIKHSFLVLEKNDCLEIIMNDNTNVKMLIMNHENWRIGSMIAFYNEIYPFVKIST